jgi:hypothetical protein
MSGPLLENTIMDHRIHFYSLHTFALPLLTTVFMLINALPNNTFIENKEYNIYQRYL